MKANAAIPGLIVIGAGVYWLYKAKPDSQATLAIKNAFGSLQKAVAPPQPAPEFALPNSWSDKSTSLYLERSTPAPDPPKISGDGLMRDSAALQAVLNTGTDYASRVRPYVDPQNVRQDFPGA